jgi:hypothetical protein
MSVTTSLVRGFDPRNDVTDTGRELILRTRVRVAARPPWQPQRAA